MMMVVVVVRAERAADEKAPGIPIGRVAVIPIWIIGPRRIIPPSIKWNTDADKDSRLGRHRSQGHGPKG
jgi:hypothetical protein